MITQNVLLCMYTMYVLEVLDDWFLVTLQEKREREIKNSFFAFATLLFEGDQLGCRMKPHFFNAIHEGII